MLEAEKTRYGVEQVRAMEFPLHRIEWTIRDDGGPQARFSCDAPEGSKCRLECAEYCGAEEWPCRSWSEDGDAPWHDMVDSEHCRVLAYWDDGTAAEAYDQDAGEAQVRSGQISLRWDGDNYLWRYASLAEQARQPDRFPRRTVPHEFVETDKYKGFTPVPRDVCADPECGLLRAAWTHDPRAR